MSQLNAASIISYSNFIRRGYPKRILMTDLQAVYRDAVSQSEPVIDLQSFCEEMLFSIKMEQSDFKFGSDYIFFRSKQVENVEKMLKPDQEFIEYVGICVKTFRAEKGKLNQNIHLIIINFY